MKKTKILKLWKPLPLEAYTKQCDQLVTHSIKSVNTNSAAGGIRIIPERDPSMPYACVRFGSTQVALDYIVNSGVPFPTSVATEQMESALTGNFENFSETVSLKERQEIEKSVRPLLEQPLNVLGTHVSPRVRQILLEDDQRRDVCLTPIHSGGFSARLGALLREALQLPGEQVANGNSSPAFFDVVGLKFGGDNPQNAGRARLVHALQKAYRFAPPRRDAGLNRALRAYYRGVSLTPPRDLLEQYGNFLERLRREDEKVGNTLQRTKSRLSAEKRRIAGMVKVILERGDAANAQIAPYVGETLAGYADDNLSLVQKGLLSPELRASPEWREAFARAFAQGIAAAQTREGTLIVGISGRSAISLQEHILEALP